MIFAIYTKLVTPSAKWVYDSSNEILGTWKGSDNNLYIVKSNNVIVLKSSSSYLEECPINVLSASSFTYGVTYTFTSTSADAATLTDSSNTVNVTMTRPTTSIAWSATNATVNSSTTSSASCTALSASPTVLASISGLTLGKTYKLFFNTSSTNNTQIDNESLSYVIYSDSSLSNTLQAVTSSALSNNLNTATVIATTTELYLNISYSLSYTQGQFSVDNLYIMEVTD